MSQTTTIANLNDLIDGINQGAPQVLQVYPADRSSQFVTLLSTITPGTTTARGAALSTGQTYRNLLSKFEVATFMLNVISATTEAGDTLDVFIDLSLDTVTWFNGIHFTQVLGNGGAKIFVAQLTFPTAAVADINVTADGAANSARNLWAPHVRVGWNNTDANANVNAIFNFQVSVALQAS